MKPRLSIMGIWFVLVVMVWSAGWPIHTNWVSAQDPQPTRFTSCSGKLSFDMPPNWVAEELQANFTVNHTQKSGPHIRLANTDDALAALAVDRIGPEGQTIELVVWPPSMPFDETDPYELLQNIRTPFDEEFDGVRTIEVNDWPAARRDSVITYEGVEIATIRVFAVLPGKQLFAVTAQSFLDNYMELDANVELLLANILWQALQPGLPAEGWDTYFEPKCTFRIAFPNDWIASESYSNQLLFFSSQDAQDTRRRRRDYKDDELQVTLILPQDIADFFQDIGFDVTDADPTAILTAYAEAESLTINAPRPVSIGSYEGLRADFAGGVLLLYDFGAGAQMLLMARSSESGFATFEATVLQMAESVEYQPILEANPAPADPIPTATP